MRSTDNLRLPLIAIGLLLAQQVWYYEFPQWHAVDFYAVFLLLLAAARGPVQGGIYAIIGASVMDSFSVQYSAFHMFYYLLPVAAGTMLRSRMLLQYRQLGALVTLGLLLLKIVGQLLAGLSMHWLSSPTYLFKLNYFPLLLEVALVYFFWDGLSRLIPPAEGGKLLA